MKLLWPSDAIWWHRFGSTLAQVMACCLSVPSHYWNQCWPSISEVLWHLHDRNFTVSAQATVLYHGLENNFLKLLPPFQERVAKQSRPREFHRVWRFVVYPVMLYANLLVWKQITIIFMCFTNNGINPWSKKNRRCSPVYITQMVAELIHLVWAQIAQIQHQAAGICQWYDYRVFLKTD